MKKFYYPLTKLQNYYQSNLAVKLLELQRKKNEFQQQQQQIDQLELQYQECDRYLAVLSNNCNSAMASLHYRRELYQQCQQAYQKRLTIETEIAQVGFAIKQEKLRIEQLKRHRQRQWLIFTEDQRRAEYHLLDELHMQGVANEHTSF